MMTSPRKYALILEFVSLAVLILSLYLLGQQHQQGTAPALWQLGVPILASLGVILGFIGSLYYRWLASAGDAVQQQPSTRIFFAILALSLVGVWVFAVLKTLKSAGLLV